MDTLTIVLSGPNTFRHQVATSLKREGFEVGPETHGHGLPSYTDPITAHEAGKPNAGHTPGTEHPAELLAVEEDDDGNAVHVPVPHDCEDAGSPYEDDPDIGWVSARGLDVDRAQAVAQGFGWQLRMHGVKTEADPDPVAEMLNEWAAMKARVDELEAPR